MKLTPTALPEVVVVTSPVFTDDRGYFLEAFRGDLLAQTAVASEFVQDNVSHSGANVLRGLHFQRENPQGKLIRPLAGAIFDVAVDVRRSSDTFGKWVGVTLTAGDGRQLWVPPGFAHGFLVLTPTADVLYKCTTVYHRESDSSVRWNDVDIAIEWPLANGARPVLSAKDADAPTLADATVFA